MRSKHPTYKLVYATPEKLIINDSKEGYILNPKLEESLKALYSNGLLTRFVLDEAHCVLTMVVLVYYPLLFSAYGRLSLYYVLAIPPFLFAFSFITTSPYRWSGILFAFLYSLTVLL
jgi:hypothetical protein